MLVDWFGLELMVDSAWEGPDLWMMTLQLDLGP